MTELERQALRKAALPAAASFALTFGVGIALTLFLVTGGLSDSRKDLPAAVRFDSSPDFTMDDAPEPARRKPGTRPGRADALLAGNEWNWQQLPGADVDFVAGESIDDLLSRHARNDAAAAPDAPNESDGAELLEEETEALPPPEIAEPAPLPEP